MAKIKKTKYSSFLLGKPSKGCSLCPNGKKSVLYITGLCDSNCFYCPLSDQRKNNDKIWINEKPVSSFDEVVEEIKLCSSKGIGITGGDPLVKMDRTLMYIKNLKKEFGKNFHIHLYTPLDHASLENIDKLYQAGLDEIRLHPLIYNFNKLDKILNKKIVELKNRYNTSFGFEIPIIPRTEKKLQILMKKIYGFADFINLNELEISDTNSNLIIDSGFIPEDTYSYSIEGSKELALKIMQHVQKINSNKIEKLRILEKNGLDTKKFKSYKLNVHFCTCELKDAFQLKNRMKRRLKNILTPFDSIEQEVLVKKTAIYHNILTPENFKTDYEALKKEKKEKLESNLLKLSKLLHKYNVKYLLESDRIIIFKKDLEKIENLILDNEDSISKNYSAFEISEYPTSDKTIMEIQKENFLN